MRKIEMVDLKGQYLKIKDEIDEAIRKVIDSSSFVRGDVVLNFQQNLERYLNVRHVIPVGNGTDALQISLMALGLKSGDEVITPSFTFVSTAEVVALLGLKPVFIDVDPSSFCMSVENVSKAITKKTKAIIPVQLFGQNADMEPINAIAKKHGLHVVEDACQSIASEYRFQNGDVFKSGCMGDLGCTSFFPSKNLGCYGDGGAIFTNDDVLAENARSIANHGMKTRYHYERIGVNSRLDSIQAAVLDVKLRYLDQYIESRRKAAKYYDEKLSDIPPIICPSQSKSSGHVYHQYTIRVKNGKRGELQSYLKEQGIPTMVYYPVPLHLQKAYNDGRYSIGDLPNTEGLASTVLSLPMHTELDEEQLAYITNNIRKFFTR